MGRRSSSRWWLLFIALALVACWVFPRPVIDHGVANALETAAEVKPAPRQKRLRVRVEVARPTELGLQRSTTQPASVRAFDFANLYAKVSGYLGLQMVDIGDRVSKGQLLAEIDAPELPIELKRAEAALRSAEARRAQAEVGVKVAEAALRAAEASLVQSRANVNRDRAALRYRESQYKRISELWKLHAIDEQLVDEKEDQFMSAQAALDASTAAVTTAEAKRTQAVANIDKAHADLRDAEAEIGVAQAAVKRAKTYTEYLKIVSPYDGVVSERNYHVGDFIREATQGESTPLFTITRTDKMRVIVQVPDKDVPFTDTGDPATIEIEALPGVKFEGQVARLANSEDATTRTMRVEIDVPNPDNRLRDGMYGYATIVLRPAALGMTIPSSCLVGDLKNGSGQVYIVLDGKARRVPVTVGQDNGIDVEILSGLTADAQVVRRYSGTIADGVAVTVVNGTEQVAKSPTQPTSALKP